MAFYLSSIYVIKTVAIVSLRFPEERVVNSLAIPHHELEKQILKSVEVSEKGAVDVFLEIISEIILNMMFGSTCLSF